MQLPLFRSFLILAVIMGIAACGQSETDRKSPDLAQKDTDTSYILTDSTVGPFGIGDILPDSTSKFSLRKEQRPGPEGPPPQTIYHVSENGEELMTINPQYDGEEQAYSKRIGEIIVLSDRYQTQQGIGPGSTIEDFITAYPEPKVWYTYVSDRFVLETKQHTHMQFLLRPEDFSGEVNPQSEITALILNDFREGATIRAVRIY